MKDTMYTLKLDKYEYGVIFNSLNDKRNELLTLEMETDVIDSALLKVIEAKEKHKGRDRSEGR
ncbi:MAG: hypothetical protein ACLROI_12445 [Beduini sp.]|uniref:hypothetical protein n=1 Tax=Beduini sp. TaxID=1922300 RepID=UPI0039906E11